MFNTPEAIPACPAGTEPMTVALFGAVNSPSGTFLAMTFHRFWGRRKVSFKQSRDQRVCPARVLAMVTASW
jgi:hypothetical protein